MMTTLVHILIDDDHVDEAHAVTEALNVAEVPFSISALPAKCQVMVVFRTLGPEDLKSVQALGGILILVRQLDSENVPSVVLSCVGAQRTVPDSDKDKQNIQTEQLSIDRIDELVDTLSETHVLEQINLFLATTQRISAPLIKAGQFKTCLVVCRHAAYSLLELLRVAEVEEGAGEVVQAIADAVSSTVLETEDESIDTEHAVDSLVDCFVQLALGLQTASALTVVEETFSDVLGSGRDASASLLYEMVKLTLDQGNPFLDSSDYSWCGHIYLLAMRNLRQLLGSARTSEDSTLSFARERLEPFSELDHDSMEYDADVLVPALHETLVDILEHAEEARRWEYDS